MWPFKKKELYFKHYPKIRENLHKAIQQYIEILRNEGDVRPVIVSNLMEELLLHCIPREYYESGIVDLRAMIESNIKFMEDRRGVKFPKSSRKNQK